MSLSGSPLKNEIFEGQPSLNESNMNMKYEICKKALLINAA